MPIKVKEISGKQENQFSAQESLDFEMKYKIYSGLSYIT